MRLGIISDAHHYLGADGRLYTLSPLARQFDQWAQMFDLVTICAPLLPGIPRATHSPYAASNIRLLPITNAGGNTLQAKLDLFRKTAGWWQTLQKLIEQVDAVHIRCPNNISILGLLAVQRTDLLRQAVYTGSWMGHPDEAPTYRWQRIFLKYFFRGPVAAYGAWPNQPDHIVPSFSPSYSQADWDMESAQIVERLAWLCSLDRLPAPVRLISVGALNQNKNQQLILQALRCLLEQGIDCTLDLLGDGGQRAALEQQAQELGLHQRVIFHGNVAQRTVRQFYRQAAFVIQSPYSEGFGKVPIEAFFHGAIPILSDVDLSAQVVGGSDRGRCFSQGDAQAIADHVGKLIRQPAEMVRLIDNGREYARGLTLEAWQQHLREMLNHHWQTRLEIHADNLEPE